MPSLRFGSYRDIATEIASRLAAARSGCDPLAPWDEDVIVPSRGAADAIAAELLTRLPNGIAGLRLQSLEELARQLLTANQQTPRVASEAERRLAMRIAVRSIDDPMMTSRGIAAMLERSYRDVRDSGITLADFTRRNRRGVRNPRRTELAAKTWSEYERVLERMRVIDPADLLLMATRLVDERVKPQLLAGFYDMTGAQLQLTQALLRAGRIADIWIPSDAPFAQRFINALDVEERQACPSTAVPAASPVLHTYDTRHDELRDVCAHVAALLANGTPAREIGIVARSFEPYDARLLNRFAEEHGFRTSLTEDIPLTAHRIGRGALTLLRLRDRSFPRTEVLGLVRDGLRTQTRIDVDAADAATRRARIAGGTSEELRRMRNRPRVVDDYIALVAELEELTASLDLAQLASRFRIETDEDLMAAERLDEVASLFKRTPRAIAADVIDADVIDAMQHESLSAPRTANRPLVWAGELLRFRGRSFTHLFAVRMQDDVFPQRRTEDPLLPDSDRRVLALREIGDGREEEELLFSLLVAERVMFSFASGDGFGKVLRPSRFVRNVAGSSLLVVSASRHQQPATSNQQRQLQLLVKTGTRSPFDGYLPPIDPETLRLSPTQLEDFGECPQKFLLKHILRVEDIDHPERELQIHHREKGSLDHRVLEKFYRSLDETELRVPLPDALTRRLDELIDEQFDDYESVAPPFNRTVRDIERRATKRLLRDFVTSDIADLLANNLVPRHFEYRFGAKHKTPADHPEPYVVEAGGAPVRVEGTVDRIDTGDGRFRIVDYKSGKALRHANLGEKIDRGVRLQLALYAMAVAEFFRADAESVSGTIKPLVLGDIKPAKFAFALHEKRDALLETLTIFIRAILSGTFPAFPNEDDDFNSCKYCPVNHSCRTRHDLDERYAVLQHKDPRTLLGGPR
ncbi:MAG TPA: PD-(D/E)XK nuclease family protein [Thermoanaerobaculia bacterium]|jgi:RecB family exonuclease